MKKNNAKSPIFGKQKPKQPKSKV